MNNKELVEKRFYPAIKEMYERSQTVFPKEELPDGFELSFDNLSRFAPYIDAEKTKRQFPIDSFYIDSKTEKEVREKAIKGLRGFYVFPYRSEFIYSDEEIECMEKKLAEIKAKNYNDTGWPVWVYEHKIENNEENKRRNKLFSEYRSEVEPLDEQMRKKEITRKEYNKRMNAIYKKYGCVKRCMDAERIQWELFNYGPNTHEEFFNAVKLAYEGKPYEYGHNKKRVEDAAKMAHDFIKIVRENPRFQPWDESPLLPHVGKCC